MSSMVIGSLGVGLLLLAFALNLIKRLSQTSGLYLAMNVIGALLAAWYAYDGRVLPFVILEMVWAVTALVRLINVIKKAPRQRGA
ncbi:MAG: hypothetical protein JSU74_03985 [Candidatus Zixiibacteriota bacterium]|nr:MAG: hypothetical protein JSU74_03985 [candidate division Zixibacteria bacterium]